MSIKSYYCPFEIYQKHLKNIEGVEFSKDEMIFIALKAHGKKIKAIGTFCGKKDKNVSNRLYDARVNAKCRTLDELVDFIRKSSKSFWFRQFYFSLLLKNEFQILLKEISPEIGKASIKCLLIFWTEQKLQTWHLKQLNDHLMLSGIHIKNGDLFAPKDLNQIIGELKNKFIKQAILLVPNVEMISKLATEISEKGLDTQQIKDNFTFLCLNDTESANDESLVNHVNLANYYESVFLLLKKLAPQIDLSQKETKFKEQIDTHFSELRESKFIIPEETKQIQLPSAELMELPSPIPEETEQIQIPSAELSGLPSPIPEETEQIQSPSAESRRLTSPIRENPASFWQDYTNSLRRFVDKERKIIALITVFILATTGVLLLVWKFKNIPEPHKHQELNHRSELIITKDTLPRSDIMAQIEKNLQGHGIRTIALTGIGGAGKTTIARRYASLYKDNIVWEINAESVELLMNSFEALALSLAQTEEDKRHLRVIQNNKNFKDREKQILSFVKNKLKYQPNWLLIFDNADNISDIQGYFPTDHNVWGQGKLIITTRDSNATNNSYIDKTIEIKELTDSEKLELFQKIIRNGKTSNFTQTQQEQMNTFLIALPPFPLDVILAAHYINTTNISYGEYLSRLTRYDKEFIEMQKTVIERSTEYSKTRYSIIVLSLNELIHSHKEFKDLLIFMSLLHSQNIPRKMLDVFKSESVIDKFIYHIKKYSLINFDSNKSQSEPATFSIHRSIQEIILNHLTQPFKISENDQRFDSMVYSLADFIEDTIVNYDHKNIGPLTNHCKTFLTYSKLLPEPLIAILKGRLGALYMGGGMAIPQQFNNSQRFVQTIDQGRKYLEESLYCLNNDKDKHYKYIIWNWIHLGLYYLHKGEYEASKNVSEEAALLCKKYLKKNEILYARVLQRLGHAYRELGDYVKAERSYKESYNIYSQYYSDHPPLIARSLLALAFVNYYLGHYELAKSHAENSAAILETYHTENYYLLADTLVVLGMIHQKLHHDEKAHQLCQCALDYVKQIFSESHYFVCWIQSNLAGIKGDLKKYKEANSLFELSLKGIEQHYGKDHVETARVLRDQGRIHMLEGDFERSEKLLIKAAEIFKNKKHLECFTCLELLADLYSKQSLQSDAKQNTEKLINLKNKAKDYLSKAKDLIKDNFPEQSPHLIRITTKINNLE